MEIKNIVFLNKNDFLKVYKETSRIYNLKIFADTAKMFNVYRSTNDDDIDKKINEIEDSSDKLYEMIFHVQWKALNKLTKLSNVEDKLEIKNKFYEENVKSPIRYHKFRKLQDKFIKKEINKVSKNSKESHFIVDASSRVYIDEVKGYPKAEFKINKLQILDDKAFENYKNGFLNNENRYDNNEVEDILKDWIDSLNEGNDFSDYYPNEDFDNK